MIHVTRTSVSEPATLQSSRTRKAIDKLAEFFDRPRNDRLQSQPPFNSEIWKAPDVKEALIQLFHKKCAYCESRVDVTSGFDVEMFRPKWQALARDGSTLFDGYWWLAYEWSNIYVACQACIRSKGSRFPIAGTPARAGTRGAALAAEKPLLLDPCSDEPDDHLVFADDGSIGSLTEHGTTTIQVLALNREGLREARRRAIERCMLLVRGKPATEDIQAILDDSQEYVGAIRQCLGAWLKQEEPAARPSVKRRSGKSSARSREQIAKSIHAKLPGISEAQRKSAVDHFRSEQRATDSYSIADASAKGDTWVARGPSSASRYITSGPSKISLSPSRRVRRLAAPPSALRATRVPAG